LIDPDLSQPDGRQSIVEWYSMSERSTTAVIVVVVLLLIGLLFIFPMLGMWMWRPMMMGGWGYPVGDGWGFMFLGMLVPLLFIGLLIVGAYYLVTSRSSAPSTDAALGIVDERYAKGEITEKQYLEMKQNLSK